MAVLIVLFTSWLVFRQIGALGVEALASWQRSAGFALAVMFVFTGIAHFNKMKHDLARMVPAMFPRPMLLVYFTVLEFAGAVGLLIPGFRRTAGICLIVLLIVMFPANVKRGDERNDSGRQARHSSRVEASHASTFYRASVVVSRP